MRESASSLVHEHQEDIRHMSDMRKRERELMDERLQRKLNKKRSLYFSVSKQLIIFQIQTFSSFSFPMGCPII